MGVLALWPILKELLYGMGILKRPADLEAERTFKLKLLELQEQGIIEESKAFQEYIRVTSPDPLSKVGSYVNSLTIIARQIIVMTIALAFVLPRLQSVVLEGAKGFERAGLSGMLLLSILLWEFYGLSALQFIVSLVRGGQITISNNGTVSPIYGGGKSTNGTAKVPSGQGNDPSPPPTRNGKDTVQ